MKIVSLYDIRIVRSSSFIQLPQHIRLRKIVAFQNRNIFSFSPVQRCVHAVPITGIFFVYDFESDIGCGVPVCYLRALICGTVIHTNKFKVLKGLVQ
jgi:hypothetical protein